jgi:outer membrane protein, heavy metal efflux system
MRPACLLCLFCAVGCRSTADPIANRVGLPVNQSTCLSPGAATGDPQVDLASYLLEASAQSAESLQQAERSGAPIRLTLREVIRTALAANPDLVALRQTEPVSAAALDVARTYPFNPQASVVVQPFTREKNGDNASTLIATCVQQEIELAHQGRYREQASSAELNRTHWGLLQAEVATSALAEQRFFAALYQRQRLELAISLANMNQQMLDVLRRRFEAGQATATDVSLAGIQAVTMRQQVELARTNYETALSDLRSTLGLSATAALELVGDLEHWEWLPLSAAQANAVGAHSSNNLPPDLLAADAATRWLPNRPDIRAAESDVDAARARLQLACASRVPNIKLGPVYERDESGTQFLGLEASMPLPVLNTGEPLARQRHAELAQRLVTLNQLKLKAKLDIEAALQRYERARRAAEEFRAISSDKLAQDVRLIEDQFNAGQADLLRVYSARTSMIQSQITHLDSLQEVARAAAAITANTGLTAELLLATPEEAQP